ncbi:MAG: hypothetical protein ACT4OP_13090, partial [Actinomycetota bacterium]
AGVPHSPPDPQFADVKPWPLAFGFEEMVDNTGFGWRCATFSGQEAVALLLAFAQANQATTWDEAGTTYSIAVRPLFPGEGACAPLLG